MSRSPYEHARQDARRPQPPTPAVAATDRPESEPYTADYQNPCDQPESPEEADLCQQWRMAEASEDLVSWAVRQFWITAVEIVLLVVTVGAAIWAAREAARAAKAAVEGNVLSRAGTVTEQRAWLAPNEIKIVSSLQWVGEKGQIAIKVAFENTGRTPALCVRIAAELRLGVSVQIQSRPVYDEVSRSAREQPCEWGSVVFPQRKVCYTFSFNITEDELSAYLRLGKTRPIRFFLVCCADYRLIFQDEPHQTCVILDISGKVPIGPAFGDTPADLLQLSPGIDGGLFVD